jgi:tetratricopeptide (TPR) repeat protein
MNMAMHERFILAIVFIGVSLLTQTAHGHGDLHERIVATTQEIKSFPDSALLYLKRGELLYQHIEYKKSIRDFKKCSKLGLQSTKLLLGYAKSYEGLQKWEKALGFLDEILAVDEGDVRALRLHGQILMKMGKYKEAALSFEKVIQFADQTFTENYMEASLAWEKENSSEGKEKARKILLEGMDQLGELVVFYDRLVDLARRQGDYEAALFYQNKLVEKSNRKERAYYQRAQIQLEKGDISAARVDLQLATEAIEKLPSRLRNIKSIKELESDIQTLIQSL